MILYLDTSAFIKLYAEEPGTEEVQSKAEKAELLAVSEIGYVEARSALARKERDGTFSTREHDEAVEHLERDFRDSYLLRLVSGGIIAEAGGLARRHALRAYDAVHLATALALREEAREISVIRRDPAQTPGSAGNPQEEQELSVSFMSYDFSLNEAARGEGFYHENND